MEAKLAALWGCYLHEGINDCGMTDVLKKWGQGHIELMSAVVNYLPILFCIAKKHIEKQEFPGVFEYEVVNELGLWIGDYILSSDTGSLPSKELVIAACENLVNTFFAQGEPA